MIQNIQCIRCFSSDHRDSISSDFVHVTNLCKSSRADCSGSLIGVVPSRAHLSPGFCISWHLRCSFSRALARLLSAEGFSYVSVPPPAATQPDPCACCTHLHRVPDSTALTMRNWGILHDRLHSRSSVHIAQTNNWNLMLWIRKINGD